MKKMFKTFLTTVVGATSLMLLNPMKVEAAKLSGITHYEGGNMKMKVLWEGTDANDDDWVGVGELTSLQMLFEPTNTDSTVGDSLQLSKIFQGFSSSSY